MLALRRAEYGASYAKALTAGRVATVEGFIRLRHSTSSDNSGPFITTKSVGENLRPQKKAPS
jgi:hypothetical protein